MESLPLHTSNLNKLPSIINISHTIIHSIASTLLLYYRLSSFLHHPPVTPSFPCFPWALIFTSELILFFLWFLNQAYGWQLVSRTVFPERLPEDHKLPAIDVFVCTADPKKEPAVKVMNTVLSAMALDYPPEKLFVYLSDDGGCYRTLVATKEAWRFGKMWVPFCRKYGVEIRCPEAYFAAADGGSHGGHGGDGDFIDERDRMKRKYEEFADRIKRNVDGHLILQDGKHTSLPVVEIIGDDQTRDPLDLDQAKIPLLVYVSREKKADVPHHFKAGALNVLLRVSGVISNSPYMLLLDCDMYCNDPSSARQAMCFHLDPKLSPSLAFVQFPQRFHNISKNDIYDSGFRSVFGTKWKGMDGLKGPMMSGTCFYIKRKALYGIDMLKRTELLPLKGCFGLSNEFIRSLTETIHNHEIIHEEEGSKTLQRETNLLASSSYELNTQWGLKIGFWYLSLVEDYFTGFMLHCRGWTSVFCNPSKPAFLGNATTSLNEVLVQGRRLNSGLVDVCLSRFCPLFYGLPRMPLPMTMCYGYYAFQPLYCFPVLILATIPQLCLLNDIPVYPKVSSSWFMLYLCIFLSSLLKLLWENLESGATIRSWWNEWRVWMLKSVTSYFYGLLDAIFKLLAIGKASFNPTNKVPDDEQFRRYQEGIFDFQASTTILAPLVTLVVLNMISFIGGLASATIKGHLDEMFGQIFLSFFILLVNKPLVEGMTTRKDSGRVLPSVTLLAIGSAIIFLFSGGIALSFHASS